MILIDKSGHMISTEGEDELHKFARKLGLKRKWYQATGSNERHPHYDLTTQRIHHKAVGLGATLVSSTDLFKHAWWNKIGYNKSIQPD